MQRGQMLGMAVHIVRLEDHVCKWFGCVYTRKTNEYSRELVRCLILNHPRTLNLVRFWFRHIHIH